MTTVNRPAAGPPAGPAAPELIAAGFELENADAGILHRGMNLADIAHLLDLSATGVIPPEAARRLLALLLATMDIPAAEFPYDPANGEPYNSRERYFVSQVGDVAGWLHAGRPRREAVRVAFRLRLRDDLTDLIEASAELAAELAARSREHADTLMADQTYLQHAQPSTFGHYLLSFAFPVLRAGQRLSEALEWTDASPGGAGCVNGSRLLSDRAQVASLLGFRSVAEHTRDAMWQVDGLFDMVGAAAGLMVTQSKLAEDLEIWASQEFDYVTLADGYSRASVLMPQKRNPYALSILRGTAGSLIGRLSGLLAVAKTPSARSDNLIFAYGEVPRALDLALRATRLSTGVVRTLQVNAERMRAALDSGFSQATDLAEYIMQTCAIDYRSAYRVVGHAVRQASAAGLRGADIDGAMLDAAAAEVTGRPLGLAGRDLSAALDPWQIVASRTALGGAAPGEVRRMAAEADAEASRLAGEARRWRDTYRAAEDALLEAARKGALTRDRTAADPPGPGGRGQRRPVPVRRRDQGAGRAGHLGGLARARGRPAGRGRRPGPALRHPRRADRGRQRRGAAPARRGHAAAHRRHHRGRRGARAWRGRTLLHCGPAIGYADAPDPLRRSMRAAAVAEGWADSLEQADARLAREEIGLAPANEHAVVVPMATALGPGAPLYVVENQAGGTTGYAPISQGPGEVAWFGVASEASVARLVFLRDVAAPVIGRILDRSGPLDVLSLAAQAVAMGDDVHVRTQAATNLLIRTWLPHLTELGGPDGVAFARFLSANHLFFLTLAMAAARSLTEWAAQVEDASIVTTMARNGTTFGIRLPGSDRWFTADAPEVGHALYYPGQGPQTSARDIGDSAVLELSGLGAAAAAGSPAVAQLLGGDLREAAGLTGAARRGVRRAVQPVQDPGCWTTRGPRWGWTSARWWSWASRPRSPPASCTSRRAPARSAPGVAEAPLSCFADALSDLDHRLSALAQRAPRSAGRARSCWTRSTPAGRARAAAPPARPGRRTSP